MGILVDIFDEERRALSERIGDGPPEKAARIIRDFLGKLPTKYEEKDTDLKRNEKRRLKRNEKRRLGFLIDLLQTASSLLVVPSTELYRPYQPDSRPVDGDMQKGTLKKAAQIILFVLLLGGLLAIGAFSALLILLLLVAVTLPSSILRNPDKWLPYLWSQTPKTDQEDSTLGEANDAQVRMTINANDLLSQLRQMIKVAETAFEDETDEPEPLPANPIHESRDLLDFFQNLLEAAQFEDTELALKTVRGLKRLLLNQDICIEDYEKGKNDHYFGFSPGTSYLMQRPALVSKDRQLLLGGTVIKPSEEK